MKLLFVVTEDWYFVSHRLQLAIAARDAGYEVVVATRVTAERDRITAAGIRLLPLELARRTGNPIVEIVRLLSLYRQERPDIIHHVALKPVVYGSIAAYLAGRSDVVNAVAGLGWLFTSDRIRARLFKPIVRRILGLLLTPQRIRVIVQNPDDAEILRALGTPSARLQLIRGAGVDTDIFAPTEEPNGPIRIVLAGRMLRDKGICEFVEAARSLRDLRTSDGRSIRFTLVGPLDPSNPAALAESYLRQWEREGVIEWWGQRKDMPGVFQSAHIVCLPSYREGLPKVLLEAAACGRPIVATDVPGCREIVQNGLNGLLVAPRNAPALARALRSLADDEPLRTRMGKAGRELVLAEFSARRVIEETLAVYRELRKPKTR